MDWEFLFRHRRRAGWIGNFSSGTGAEQDGLGISLQAPAQSRMDWEFLFRHWRRVGWIVNFSLGTGAEQNWKFLPVRVHSTIENFSWKLSKIESLQE
jgi:hypothetical protein